MRPTAGEFEAFLRWADEFPRPDWRRLWETYCREPGRDHGSPEHAHLQRLWLARLARHLGGSYAVHESPRLLLLAECPPDASCEPAEYLTFGESALDVIRDALEAAAPPDCPGKLPVLVLTEEDDYYPYISDYYPPEGHYSMSGGVCLRRDEPHVVVNAAEDQPRTTLAHELAHACLGHLTLPAWAEEGVVAVMQYLVCDAPRTASLSRPERDAHAQFWGPAGLQSFWAGDAFHDPDAAPFAYQLAEVMVHTMNRRAPRPFEQFLLAARFDDAGEEAAIRCFGCSLVAVVEECIGPGPWLPPFPKGVPPR